MSLCTKGWKRYLIAVLSSVGSVLPMCYISFMEIDEALEHLGRVNRSQTLGQNAILIDHLEE